METIGKLGAENSKLQAQIDSLQQILDTINIVLDGEIDWQSCVALSCVASFIQNEIELLDFQKELNKKEMSNLLLQALQQ